METEIQFWTVDDLAARYRVCAGTIRRWVAQGVFPAAFSPVPRVYRWRIDVVLAWEQECERAARAAQLEALKQVTV